MKKPNILWICTDQQRYDGLGCYGNEKLDTPHIDALAAQGVLFQNTYCQSPICSPSRASFLTGRYPRTCRLRQNGQMIPEDEVPISRLFAEQGYSTGLAGKLHLAPCHPDASPAMEPRIRDGYHVFHWSHHPDYYGNNGNNWPLNEYNNWLRRKGTAYERTPYKGSSYVYTGMSQEYHQSRWCSDMAIEFIDAHREYEIPWFFSLNFYDPHHDFDPPADLLNKYIKRLKAEDLPRYVEGEWDVKTDFQKMDHRGAYGTPGFMDFEQMTQEDHLQVKAAYYAMIEMVDLEVGRVMETLKRTGQLDHTIVIFTSDHGEMLGDHGIYLKGPYFYAPLVKVPLIMSWPGHILSGVERKALVELLDIAPTLLELAELFPCPKHQGKSLKPLLMNPEASDSHRGSVYSEYYNAMKHHKNCTAYVTMVANQRYKLVYCHNKNQGELYDLEADPNEFYNLYGNAAVSQVQINMLEEMTNRMAYTSDPMPERTAVF